MMKISKTLSVGISFVLSLIFALALLVIGAVAWNYTAVLFPGSGLQPLPAVGMSTYPEIIVALVADAMLIKLLHNVSRESVFIPENVACIRTISWMCFAEALLFTGEGVASLMSEQTAAGQNRFLFAVFLIIAFACAFMGLIVRVVKNIIEQATAIKAENDFTV